MQFISYHNGQIFTSAAQWGSSKTKTFCTGLSAIDDLLPASALACGAILTGAAVSSYLELSPLIVGWVSLMWLVIAVSGQEEPVEMIAFYAGVKGTPITIPQK